MTGGPEFPREVIAESSAPFTLIQQEDGTVKSEIEQLEKVVTELGEKVVAIEEGKIGPVYVGQLICGSEELGSANHNREVIQAAIDALYNRGGTIWLPSCDIFFAGSLNLVERFDIIFQGRGGQTAGSPAATRLIHMGLIGPPVSPIEAKSSFGIVFRDMQILNKSNLSECHLISMAHNGASGGDSAYNRIERCNIGGLENSTAFSLLNLDEAIQCSFHSVHFGAAKCHVRGITESQKYSNAHSFYDCTFVEATVMPVLDPGEGWTFINPTVEALASGAAGFISENESVENTSKGLGIIGGWFGDANATGDWIRFSGTGFASYGSRVGTGGSFMRIGAKGAVEGVAIIGGHFDSVTNLLVVKGEKFGKSHKDWVVFGNHYINTGGISFGAGTIFPERSIIDNPKDRIYMPGMITQQAGPISDAVFPVPPPAGTMAYDSTNKRLYIKSTGEVWKKSPEFT